MKELQNGRSMIEMLGVLAIIGVLSIGGLAGYTMAMNRHRANQVLDYVSRCAVIAQTKGDGSQAPSGTCSDLMEDEDQPSLTSAVVSGTVDQPIVTLTWKSGTDKVKAAVISRLEGANVMEINKDGTTITFNPTSSGS